MSKPVGPMIVRLVWVDNAVLLQMVAEVLSKTANPSAVATSHTKRPWSVIITGASDASLDHSLKRLELRIIQGHCLPDCHEVAQLAACYMLPHHCAGTGAQCHL